jgi:hypothetical protein
VKDREWDSGRLQQPNSNTALTSNNHKSAPLQLGSTESALIRRQRHTEKPISHSQEQYKQNDSQERQILEKDVIVPLN